MGAMAAREDISEPRARGYTYVTLARSALG